MRVGAQGVKLVKPEDGGGLPNAEVSNGNDAVVDAGADVGDEYDDIVG